MIGFRYLLPAEEEITEAAIFYESKSQGLGAEFLDDIQRAINRVCTHPESGQKYKNNFRRYLLRKFPFSLIYNIEQDHILILAVTHHSRRPNYWKDRIEE